MSTALINISCNHEYYRSLLYLELYSAHHNVLVALFVLHQQRKLAEIHLLMATQRMSMNQQIKVEHQVAIN